MKKLMMWVRGLFAVEVPESLFAKVVAGDFSAYQNLGGYAY